MAQAVFFGQKSFSISDRGFKHITAEGTDIRHIVKWEGTIYIGYPFTDITGHIIKAIVIRKVRTAGCRDICSIVQVAGNAHVVAFSTFEVIHEGAVISWLVGTDIASVPGIVFTFNNPFIHCISDEAESSIFPFGFSWQPVFRQHDTIFHFYFPGACPVRIQIGHRLVDKAFVLPCKVGFSVEVIIIFLGRVHGKDSFSNQEHFIHPVASPGAIIISLLPCNADDRVIPVSGMAEIIFHKRFVICKPVTPNQSIGKGFAVYAGIICPINPVQPV